MRAYGFTALGGPEREAFLDVPEPVRGRGRAAGAGARGRGEPGRLADARRLLRPDGPAVLGREVAGTVAAVGAGRHRLRRRRRGVRRLPRHARRIRAAGAGDGGSFAAHRPYGVSPGAGRGAAGRRRHGLRHPREPATCSRGARCWSTARAAGSAWRWCSSPGLRGLAVVGTASPAKHDLLTRLGAMPVAYGDGVADRIRAAAADGIDGALDLVGGEALRVLGGLVPARAAVLGRRQAPGQAARRGRGGARPEHRGAHASSPGWSPPASSTRSSARSVRWTRRTRRWRWSRTGTRSARSRCACERITSARAVVSAHDRLSWTA